TADDGVSGRELYAHDPVTGTTTRVEDIASGPTASTPTLLTAISDIIEAGSRADGTPFPGDPLATGNVLTNDTDADTGDTKEVVGVAAGTVGGPLAAGVGDPIVGTYGTLVLDADGVFNYTLDNVEA
ncbi:unnamed protein product, partial [marine sediment metagenome]